MNEGPQWGQLAERKAHILKRKHSTNQAGNLAELGSGQEGTVPGEGLTPGLGTRPGSRGQDLGQFHWSTSLIYVTTWTSGCQMVSWILI